MTKTNPQLPRRRPPEKVYQSARSVHAQFHDLDQIVDPDDLAPVSGGMDAQTLYGWLCNVLTMCMSAPDQRPPGNCLFCRRFSYNLTHHLALFGPHAEAWAHAILGTFDPKRSDGRLSPADWRRLVLFTSVWMLIDKHTFRKGELRTLKWLLAQDVIIPFDEEVDHTLVPRCSMSEAVQFGSALGLEFVLPFADRLVDWAKETTRTIQKLTQANSEFSNRV